MTEGFDLGAGVRNLLVNCAQLKSDETLVIIHEDPDLGWYDAKAPKAVGAMAKELGVTATYLQVGAPGNHPDPAIDEAIAAHDCTIFFARTGDQTRFAPPIPGKRQIMCYARNAETLGSTFGRVSHLAFQDFKAAINEVLLSAGRVEIKCPLGTDCTGTISANFREQQPDVSVLRFPLGVPVPVEASEFSGRVALTGYLTPTGSKVYDPACLKLNHTIIATFSKGRITGFEGEENDAARVRDHYRDVSDQLTIDPDVVHSWHAGIHPGTVYPNPMSDDPERWAENVFTSPRYLHFHTCGDYAPGEICWMVRDHTVSIDGVDLWADGELRPQAFEPTNRCLENWPELAALFPAALG